MNATECTRLGAYLSKLLGSPTVSVAPRDGDGVLLVDGNEIADVMKDEEEGETSYSISLALPRAKGAKKDAPIDASERERLQIALREKLHAAELDVRQRPRKTDSAEVYVHDEFIGTLSADEDEGYFLTMSILDIDLNGED